MPTIALVDTEAHPDGFHNVRSPGGYEWWYFDAQDTHNDIQVVAILMHGFIFHPGYIRQLVRHERHPTRHAPPTPDDAICAYLCIYQSGQIAHQFITQFPRSVFGASREGAQVTIGPSTLRTEAGVHQLELAGHPWKLTGRGPVTDRDATLRASLTFTPRFSHPLSERTFLSHRMTGAHHKWVIASPLCEVSGSIGLDGATTSFKGVGYHDHNYGTGPIGPGLHRWIWGRAMFDDAVITFHHAEPQRESLGPETHLLHADEGGMVEVDVDEVVADWSARCWPAMGLTYPSGMVFGDALRLTNPRIIDPAPFYMRLMFDAETRGLGPRSATTRTGTALCEIAYPHRLRWPLLGRMIEMSIDKRV